MANTPEHHVKLIIGDIAGRLAMALAEIERLQEELAALKAKAPKEPAP